MQNKSGVSKHRPCTSFTENLHMTRCCAIHWGNVNVREDKCTLPRSAGQATVWGSKVPIGMFFALTRSVASINNASCKRCARSILQCSPNSSTTFPSHAPAPLPVLIRVPITIRSDRLSQKSHILLLILTREPLTFPPGCHDNESPFATGCHGRTILRKTYTHKSLNKIWQQSEVSNMTAKC